MEVFLGRGESKDRNRESLQLGALPPRWEPVAIAATEDVGL